ncbi:hypothetical protein G6L12_05905 [Agrobacterium rhizogenes]|nr:hypothetical protein [Rhizobium rhizogenes]NTF74009.1 hypothetical protein [Rhizobium rhizogenes]
MTSISIDRIDGLSSATAFKGPCRAATTANIALYGLQTIDGISIVQGDRVLVKSQTAPYENGIYAVDTGQWRRVKDFSRTTDVREGTQVLVTDGATYERSLWLVTSSDPVIIGTDAITFLQTIVSAAELEAMVDAAEAAALAAEAAQAAAEAAAAALPAITPNTMLVDNAAGTLRQSRSFADVRSVLSVPIHITTRAVLKALDTTKDTDAFLEESGREGQFIWRTGDFSTQIAADTAEGIYLKANAISATLGAWVRQGEWIVDGLNSKWFGVVADGTTDDTAAIQAAVNFAGFLGRGVVLLPAGNIKTTAVVNILSNYVKIRGAGMSTTTVKPATAGQNCFVFGDGTTILQYCGLSGISIEPTAQIACGVKGRNYYWLDIESVRVAGSHNTGFEMEKGPTASYLAVMRDCLTISSTNYGSLLGASGTGSLQNVLMYNCHFDNAGQFGARAESVSGWIWIGGEALTCGRAIGLVPAASQSVRACLFQGIFFDTSTNEGLYAAIADNTRRISTIGFVNCSFNNSVAGVGAGLLGLSADATRLDKIRFVGCEFTINHSHGVFTQYCKDIDVSACQLISNGITSGNGVLVGDGTAQFRMIGGSSGSGSGFSNTQLYGVQVGTATDVLIDGVNLAGNVTAPFTNTAGTNVKVQNCQGFKTKASGASTMPTGGSVVVTHGLAATPVCVMITPLADPQVRYFVPAANLTSTTFTVACNVAPGAAWNFMWEAWSIHE